MLNVLFLDTGNTTESLIAESVLRSCAHGRFHAWSAGCVPSGIASPAVIAFLRARNLPVEGLRSKSLREVAAADGPSFAFVITLSDPAARTIRDTRLHGDPVVAHWHLEAGDEVAPSVWTIRDAFWVLSRRIKIFASLPHGRSSRHALENRLHALQSWQ